MIRRYQSKALLLDIQESIDRFGIPLTGLLMSWGVSSADAAELAQDSIADAHLSLSSCRGNANDPIVFGRWLRGIVRNKFRDWSRSRSRRQRLGTATDPIILDHVVKETGIVDERLLLLRKEIDQLPAKQREVVMMHYLDETSVENVAAILGVTVKSVEGRLYQARKTLRRRMDDSSSLAQVMKAVLL